MKKRYIGDGVYVSFDGYNIWLSLDGEDRSKRIALEPAVLVQLDAYRHEIAKEHGAPQYAPRGEED